MTASGGEGEECSFRQGSEGRPHCKGEEPTRFEGLEGGGAHLGKEHSRQKEQQLQRTVTAGSSLVPYVLTEARE